MTFEQQQAKRQAEFDDNIAKLRETTRLLARTFGINMKHITKDN